MVQNSSTPMSPQLGRSGHREQGCHSAGRDNDVPGASGSPLVRVDQGHPAGRWQRQLRGGAFQLPALALTVLNLQGPGRRGPRELLESGRGACDRDECYGLHFRF